jgi:hypothetical protein
MSSNFNCSYMTRSSLTYIRGFPVKCFFQPIYTKISYILKGDIKGFKHLYRLCLRTVKTVHIMSKYELGILMSSNYVVKLKRTAKSHWITKSVNKNVQYLDNFITFRTLICPIHIYSLYGLFSLF